MGGIEGEEVVDLGLVLVSWGEDMVMALCS